MEVIRTEQIRIEYNENISNLCHLSKNLYNEANYIIRQEFFKNGRWIRYNELVIRLNSSENYKSSGAQSSQQTLKFIDRDWSSFFNSIKEYKKNPSKFLGRPRIPKYKPKDGESIFIFTNQRTKIKDGYLTFPQKLPLSIKTRLPSNTNLREIRIIPKSNHYICEIVYKTLSEEGEINKRWYARRINNNRIIGIDLGLRNIVTIANNIGEQPIVIKGGVLKSMNQFYNKRKAELQSVYDLQGTKHRTKMSKLYEKHSSKIKDVMHKISRYIIEYCIHHNIGTIVFGYNDGWKQNIELGKRNNQNFVSIPHYKLIQMIQYKSEKQGIIVKLQEESHTSKCSFLDGESVEHHETYLGERIRRGIFRSSKGILINADVQGSYNIIKKAFPNAFMNINIKGIEGVGLHPKRCDIKKILSFKDGC